ncbi:MAG TPA: MerR family transcriptional regulator [Caldimonas sp.]|jgi:DNA-binding transcriptional MerR regulator|nr:MerR family transcriptional regulator [Caldimonas sp.]HEX2541811.1 MerR family transcriptional regulator [Caldimonas sp.]
MEKTLPAIPAKRYFTIGEVSDLCGVKPYVLRYWEQEFTQLKPMKRRGNRRYYQHHEVLLIRRIRELLYEQGFTISGARNRLTDGAQRRDTASRDDEPMLLSPDTEGAEHDGGGAEHDGFAAHAGSNGDHDGGADGRAHAVEVAAGDTFPLSPAQVRQELLSIRALLGP